MVGNDTEQRRDRLTVMLSDDEGASWKHRRQVEPSEPYGKAFDYPSIIQTRDGLIHLSYSPHHHLGSLHSTYRHEHRMDSGRTRRRVLTLIKMTLSTKSQATVRIVARGPIPGLRSENIDRSS